MRFQKRYPIMHGYPASFELDINHCLNRISKVVPIRYPTSFEWDFQHHSNEVSSVAPYIFLFNCVIAFL